MFSTILTLFLLFIVLAITKQNQQQSKDFSFLKYWWLQGSPLGLPPGTVRAFIVLGLTYLVIFVIVRFAAYHEELPLTIADLLKQLLPAIVLIIDRYIQLRSNGKQIDNNNDSNK